MRPCQIAADARRCEPLDQDDETIAIMDIHPANSGHCLVIPKKRAATILEVEPETFAAVGRMAVPIANAVQSALGPDGISLVQANGVAAGQTESHLHAHVLPRRTNDALPLNWRRTSGATGEEIALLARRIRAHLPGKAL